MAAPSASSARNGNDSGEGAESVSEVSLDLSTLPAGVACVQVNATAAGVPVISGINIAASGAAWSSNVALGGFSKGTVTILASAYNEACTTVTTTSVPTWIADAATIDVTPGRPNPVTLNFKQNFPLAASSNFQPSVVDIAVGSSATGFVFADGTVKVLGSVPQPTGATNVAELALGAGFGCLRKLDGTVWCWGLNTYGQLGNNSRTSSGSTLVQASGVVGATKIVTGSATSCAITTTNAAFYCWGNNGYGQLQDGTFTDALVPKIVNYASSVSMQSGSLCFIDPTGLLPYCAGDNQSGQLGDGTTNNSSFLVNSSQIAMSSISSGGQHTCSVDSTGHALCWGNNSYGQLGLGTTTNALRPQPVTAFGTPVAEVALANYSTCFRLVNGAVYCNGFNTYGALGDSTNVNRTSPYPVVPSGSKKLRGSNQTFCSLQSDASVLCWGYNGSGQLGDGTFVTSNKPLLVKL